MWGGQGELSGQKDGHCYPQGSGEQRAAGAPISHVDPSKIHCRSREGGEGQRGREGTSGATEENSLNGVRRVRRSAKFRGFASAVVLR